MLGSPHARAPPLCLASNRVGFGFRASLNSPFGIKTLYLYSFDIDIHTYSLISFHIHTFERESTNSSGSTANIGSAFLC